jgi:hypothetical protein
MLPHVPTFAVICGASGKENHVEDVNDPKLPRHLGKVFTLVGDFNDT